MTGSVDPIVRDIEAVSASPLFDADWYCREYPDVALLDVGPAEHFVRYGARMGRDPGPRFSTLYYLERYPDVAAAKANPLVHYIRYGGREGRATQPGSPGAVTAMGVDVVVPVFNARADVERCLESLRLRQDGCRLRALVVNDGSDRDTSDWLRGYCAQHDGFELIEHGSNLGYTRAVNTGLRASDAAFVVTLNSDTVVTHGWLKGMLRCMASGANVGIVGPMSNAASWQNVPELLDADGAFAVNALPGGMSPDAMAGIVAKASLRLYPRVPFVNGFCFMIRRDVIDTIGYMDEKAFPVGYGEENDFCIRAADAGFELAVADDAYVFHAKSKSFGHERRKELSRQGSEALKAKHSPAKVAALVARIKQTSVMDGVRGRIRSVLLGEQERPPADIASMRILFLLPVRGGGGGAHSVVQEAVAMRRLGVDARVAVRDDHADGFRSQYSDIADIGEVLVPFRPQRLPEVADGYDVVVATIYSSMRMVEDIVREHPHILPVYYVQDYEPLFFSEGSHNRQVALDSYTLVPTAVLFAKTHWLVNEVARHHGLLVHKVEPSLDHEVYRPLPRVDGACVRLAAMIRPATPRRGAARTLRVLSRVAAENPGRVELAFFGCTDAELEGPLPACGYRNHGVLARPGVAALLAASDVFVDLSDYQAFGRTALEAMACGSTAMVPACGGADEYAIDGVNAMVVESTDEDECVRRLNEVVRSPDVLARMRHAALSTASRYSVHRAAVSELSLLSLQLSRYRAAHPKPEKPRLVVIPSVRKDGQTPTGSAWVRCLLPYQSKPVREVWSIAVGSRRNLPAPGSADVALLQRDASGIDPGEVERWITDWKAHGGRLVYEVDDDLLDGEGLRRRGYSGDTGVLAGAVRHIASNADLVTVSTAPLADRFGELNRNIHVVPNRLDSATWRLGQPDLRRGCEARADTVRIGYIGTPTHDADLALIAEAMRRIQREYGERVSIEVIGGFEHARPTFGTRIGLPRRNDYPSFVNWLFERVNWDIGLLPLAEDAFNASKSHLKFIEYGALGLAVVCSDRASYRGVARNGENALVVPDDEQAWYDAVRLLVEDAALRRRLSSEARSMVASEHTIEHGSSQYLDVLSASLAGDASALAVGASPLKAGMTA